MAIVYTKIITTTKRTFSKKNSVHNKKLKFTII